MPPSGLSWHRPFTCALLVVTTLSSSGCSNWQPVSVIQPAIDSAPKARHFRVTTRNGQVHELREAIYRNDSVLGRPSRNRSSPAVGFALSEVATLERREANAGKTAGGILDATLVAVIALGVIMAIALRGASFGPGLGY